MLTEGMDSAGVQLQPGRTGALEREEHHRGKRLAPYLLVSVTVRAAGGGGRWEE